MPNQPITAVTRIASDNMAGNDENHEAGLCGEEADAEEERGMYQPTFFQQNCRSAYLCTLFQARESRNVAVLATFHPVGWFAMSQEESSET